MVSAFRTEPQKFWFECGSNQNLEDPLKGLEKRFIKNVVVSPKIASLTPKNYFCLSVVPIKRGFSIMYYKLELGDLA